MIVTPHLLVGAAIGAKIRNFGWVIILALLSHALLDRIPHWDYGSDVLEKFVKNKSYKILFIFFLQMLIDGLIGLIIVLVIVWQKNMLDLDNLSFIAVGILASAFPDVVLGVTKLFSKQIPKFSKVYINIHEKILHHPKHIKKPTLLGLGTEIIVSIIAALILIF